MSDYDTRDTKNALGVPCEGATRAATPTALAGGMRVAGSAGDDGSLAFLNIPRDPTNKSWPDNVVKQGRLVNTTFWVIDYQIVSTRYTREKGSEGQCLVLIKDDPAQADADARKFFTGSKEIRYVLEQLRTLDAFPRRVTLRGSGNRYWLE